MTVESTSKLFSLNRLDHCQINRTGTIFSELQRENSVRLPASDYQLLWQAIQEIGQRKGKRIDDFLSREQGLVTLKFLKGENVFGVIPTSGGKSLTFQTVAQLTQGLTIVISPLIALMKDQVKYDDEWLDSGHKGKDWLYFNSELKPEEKRKVRRQIRDGQVRLLYISPERLASADFIELLKYGKQRVKRIVIDEAHCILEWGENFRIAYFHIGRAIQAFKESHPQGRKIGVLLLTATATTELQQAIVKNLKIQIRPDNYITQREGADRPELRIEVQKFDSDEEKIEWIVEQLKGRFRGKRGIIFSTYATRGEKKGYNAEMIYQALRQKRVKRVRYYHGQMDTDERAQIQANFQNCDLNLLVATKAFGMGVDLPSLDFIIHFYPPLSLEEYWQEAGRGGRGKKAEEQEFCDCIVLHKPSDYDHLKDFLNVTRFEKVLNTFTCAARRELFFRKPSVQGRGQLAKVLAYLHSCKDIRQLNDIHVTGGTLTRWKLVKSPDTITKHIKAWLKANGKRAIKATRRLRDNIQILAASKPNVIRVPTVPHYFDTFARELNQLTYPEIGILEWTGDRWVTGRRYICFEIVDNRLSLQNIDELARRSKIYIARRRAKLDFVFYRFLSAKPEKAKSIILKYLDLLPMSKKLSVSSTQLVKHKQDLRSVNYREIIRSQGYYGWALLNESGDKAFVIPVGRKYVVVDKKGKFIAQARTMQAAIEEIVGRADIDFDMQGWFSYPNDERKT